MRKEGLFSNGGGRLDACGASYRRVYCYTKSLERYRKERERRRKVRLLAARGLTQKQIARELGVCTRTVKRDWDRVRSYVRGQSNREMREKVERERREFPQKYGRSYEEMVALLKQDVEESDRRERAVNPSPAAHGKPLGQLCREMDITLDLDCPAPNGFPSVTIIPAEGVHFSGEFDLRVNACKNGQKRELCSLHFSP
jgi:transcriptional regulator with XRE-family HTH domain